MLKAIVNVNQNWGIGYQGQLLCSFKEDLQYFRTVTMGKTVVYGRKTLEGFPGQKALKGRKNIVLSHNKSNLPDTAKKECDFYAYMQKFKSRDAILTGVSMRQWDDTKPVLLNGDRTTLILVDKVATMLQVAAFIGSIENTFVCGGASIYKQLLPYCDEVYVTKCQHDGPIDAYFPNLDEMSDEWSISMREGEQISNSGVVYEIMRYNRKDKFYGDIVHI